MTTSSRVLAAQCAWFRSNRPALRLDPLPDARPGEDRLRDERWRVLLHNDNFTPMNYVVVLLQEVFDLSKFKAVRTMLKAHILGLAEVGRFMPREAKKNIDVAHARARGNAWPLRFSCEPQ